MTFWDYMVAAFAFGVNGSYNPYALAMVLCFLCLLALVGDAPKKIALAGTFTVSVIFLLTFFCAWGDNALWFEDPTMNRILNFLSLGVAVFLLTTGYVLFRQWRQGKTSAVAQPLPRFLRGNVPAATKSRSIVFLSVIVGSVTVLVSFLWPKDQNLYILYYLLFASGGVFRATLFFALYSLAVTCLFLMVWGIVHYISRCEKLRNDFCAAISWLRICFSAVFIAVGLGLVYLFTIK